MTTKNARIGASAIHRDTGKVGTVRPGEEKAQGYVINIYKYLMLVYKEDADRLFSAVPNHRKRGNGHK